MQNSIKCRFLYEFVQRQDLVKVKELVEELQVDVNYPALSEGKSLYFHAIKCQYPYMVALMIELGAVGDFRTLRAALEMNDEWIVRLVLDSIPVVFRPQRSEFGHGCSSLKIYSNDVIATVVAIYPSILGGKTLREFLNKIILQREAEKGLFGNKRLVKFLRGQPSRVPLTLLDICTFEYWHIEFREVFMREQAKRGFPPR